MPLTRVHPANILCPRAESSPPHDRCVTVGGLALPTRLGIGHHAEAPAREKGERLGVGVWGLACPRTPADSMDGRNGLGERF